MRAAASEATTVEAVDSLSEWLIALLIWLLIELLFACELLLLLFALLLELELLEPAGGACLRFIASLKHFEHMPSVAGLP